MTLKPIVQVKSHARPVKKVKREEALRSNISNIPFHLRTRYLNQFQPGFIWATITISKEPWQKLTEDEAGVLLEAAFPELDHTVRFGDMFYALVCTDESCIKLVSSFWRQTRL